MLFNLFFHLSATDTLLVGIKDLGTPIRSMVQNDRGEIFIQLGDQVFKLENENLENKLVGLKGGLVAFRDEVVA